MFDNETFIEQLLLRVMPDIDDAGLELMIEDTQPVLEDWLMTNIIALLTENQAKTFTLLLEKKGNDQEIVDFLNKEVSDFESKLSDMYDSFETMYIKEFDSFSDEFDK